jgi:V8-like Glu-specific endopeptidase
MKHMTLKWPSTQALILAVLLIQAPPLRAQISAGGTPPSAGQRLAAEAPTVVLPAPDHELLLAEDEGEPKDLPLRFGTPLEVQLDLRQAGRAEDLPDGGRLWRLRIHSPGARSLNLLYDDFSLPPGARLFLYNDDRSLTIGAFTELNNMPDGSFATQPLSGDAITLEYEEPAGAAWPGRVRASRVVHAYRNLFGWPEADRDYGDSGACNNNVRCPEGNPWAAEIRSVAMILTGGGYRICSGALVNNAAQDQTQYFLTANHCLGGETNWIFMFNYQSPGCFNQNGITLDTVQGSIRRANNADSDVALLQLTEAIPPSYGVVFAGWSRVDVAPTAGVCIHHPNGDIKKISFENNALVSDRYLGNQGVVDSHWKVINWDDGTTEPGSSGSPVFDPNHRIVGQLHGGYASCSSPTPDWFGKFSMSWGRGSSLFTRLRDWLDPFNSQLTTLNALDPQNVTPLAFAGLNVLSSSDGDLVPEPGETVELAVLLLNQVASPLNGVTGTLTSNTPWLGISQGTASWPTLPAGQSEANLTPFVLQVDAQAPPAGLATLSLAVGNGSFTTTLGLGLDIGQRLVYWQDDVEAGDNGWTHGAPAGWSDAWHRGTQDSHSPDHGWKCGAPGAGDYPVLLDARLDSPPLTLWPYSRLRFWHRIQASVSSVFPDSAYDSGILELSADNGATWAQLMPETGYSHVVRWRGPDSQPGTQPLPPFSPCWSGNQPWQEVRADLSAWGGQTVRWRLRFGSDANGGSLGWFVDDFLLEGLDPTPPPVMDLSIHLAGNGMLQLSWSAVSGAARYRVERRAGGAAPWQPWVEVTEPGLMVASTPGMHFFRVIALAW